jgi:hypothetical protein
VAQAEEDLLPAVDVQAWKALGDMGLSGGRRRTQEVVLIGVELCELADLPTAGAHEGLDGRGDALEQVEGIVGAGEVCEVAIPSYEGVVFCHGGREK